MMRVMLGLVVFYAALVTVSEASEGPRLGIAKPLKIDGKDQPSNAPSYFVRLDLEQEGQPFEITSFEYLKRDEKTAALVQQKGLIALQGKRLMLTIPGPRVDRVVIGTIEDAHRQIEFVRRVEEVFFKPEQLKELKERIRKLGFEGDDTFLDNYLANHRVRVQSQHEVWLVNDFKLADGIQFESGSRALTLTRTLNLETWGRGTVRLNIQAACEALVKTIADGTATEKARASAGQLSAELDGLFKRAIRDLK